MRPFRRFAPLALLCATFGCGTKPALAPSQPIDFRCNERRVEYVVSGGFAGAEAGVAASCQSQSATLVRWRVDDSGARDTARRELSPAEFEDLWKRVGSTGWRNLDEDCANPAAEPTDPAYTIEIAEGDTARTFSCAGQELPFPYDAIVNELDLAAGSIQ